MSNDMEQMEQLRAQFDVLRLKLASQQIVNERMVRKVVKGKMAWNKDAVWLAIWVAMPLVALFFGIFWGAGMISGRFYIFIVTACAVDTWLDYRINRTGDRDWLEGDLVSARRAMVEMNRLRKKVFWCEMPLVALIAFGLCLEFYVHGQAEYLYFAVPFGAVVGGVAAFGIYRKMQRNNDEAIRAIDDIADEAAG